MTNKEKYPNVDDAMKAFKEHKEKHGCDCAFEKWLDTDEDAIKREAKKFFSKSLFSSLLFGAIYKDLTDETLPKINKDETSTNGVECPICHSKEGHIKDGIFPSFTCDSCGIYLSTKITIPLSTKIPNLGLSTSDFKEFLSDLCKKNKKA